MPTANTSDRPSLADELDANAAANARVSALLARPTL